MSDTVVHIPLKESDIFTFPDYEETNLTKNDQNTLEMKVNLNASFILDNEVIEQSNLSEENKSISTHIFSESSSILAKKWTILNILI